MRRLLALSLALTLAACNAANRSALPTRPFDSREAAFIKAQGAATIEGQAFLRDPTGQVNVRYAAGETVRLIPVTSYSRDRIAALYGGRKFVPAAEIPKVDADPAYVAYTRTTVAGPTGKFSFDHVAPGAYYIASQLLWKPKDALLTQGGAMIAEVTVTGREQEPIDMVLSGN